MTPNDGAHLLLSYQRKMTWYLAFISDFQELNKGLKHKPFPIPKINDLLLKLEGFQYATSLDLNVGYYHIELDLLAQEMCTIALPWGNTDLSLFGAFWCVVIKKSILYIYRDKNRCKTFILSKNGKIFLTGQSNTSLTTASMLTAMRHA